MLAIRAQRAFDGEQAIAGGALVLTNGGRISVLAHRVETALVVRTLEWPADDEQPPGSKGQQRYMSPS